MTPQWLLERIRNRDTDREKSLRSVRERGAAEAREALADYDAFVEPARAVTDGLLIGTARSSANEQIPIRLGLGEEHAHWLVQGGTGTGKTTWISSILHQELLRRQPFGVVDCKGDLFETAIRLMAATAKTMDAPEREALRQRLVVINPFGECLVPLNVCSPLPGCSAEVQAYEISLALSRLFDTALGLHMESILRHLILLLIEAGLSLVEGPQVLQDDLLRGVLATRSQNSVVAEFFLRAWPTVPKASKDALVNRLQALLLSENLRLMLGAEGLVDFRRILDRGDPLLVFLGKGPGVPEEQVEVLGSLLLQLLLQATYARGAGARSYLLVIDEFFHLLPAPAIARRFETALTTARSFGLALALIHHNFAQLPPTLREIILGNCDLIALFRTSGRNTQLFGDVLPEAGPEAFGSEGGPQEHKAKPRRDRLEAIQRLPNRHCYWYDRRKPHRAIRVQLPDVLTPHGIAGLDSVALEQMVRRDGWDRGALALTREELKRQIEARRGRLEALLRPPVCLSRPMETESPPKGKANKRRGPKIG